MIKLHDHWHEDERGNTLLTADNGAIIAWIGLQGDNRLEVSFYPDNYPALSVQVVKLDEVALATHINTNLSGWYVRRLNLDGVSTRNGYVVGVGCKRCGSDIDRYGFCTDETCPYSDRQQTDSFTEC
jgi:hypothetical protein